MDNSIAGGNHVLDFFPVALFEKLHIFFPVFIKNIITCPETGRKILTLQNSIAGGNHVLDFFPVTLSEKTKKNKLVYWLVEL